MHILRVAAHLLLLSTAVLSGILSWSHAAPVKQTVDFAEIDAYLEAQMAEARIPGLALAIVHEDQIVHLRGFGKGNPAGQPVTPQTPFILGSLSKSFTALAVMQLVEAGQLELDMPVQQYLPWFQMADANASQITVRHLLNQTSGIPEPVGQRSLADGYGGDDAFAREVRRYRSAKLTYPPGSRMQYSNANFNLLGMVVQSVSGQPYETYVEKHIFAPLAMQHSHTSWVEAQQDGAALGYRTWFGMPVAARNLPYPRAHVPSGYLIASAEDMAHYLVANLNAGRYGSATLLSPAGMVELHRPSPAKPMGYLYSAVGCDNQTGASYAMGWWNLELSGIPVICHTGDTPSFHADMVLIPEGKWGIVLLINVGRKAMSEDIHGLITGVTSLVDGHALPRTGRDWTTRGLYMAMAAVLLIEIVANVRLCWRLRRPVAPAWDAASVWGRVKYVGLPLLFSLLGAAILVLGMPRLVGDVPLAVIRINQPDFVWMMLVTAALVVLRGALQSGSRMWALRRPDLSASHRFAWSGR